jgi:non-specific serine/threonine protein kinase
MMMVTAPPLVTGSPPIPRTRLIGRRAERAVARALLLDEVVPLLTLTGPGGSGKTRLALAVAGDVAPQFADGVAWVDLAPLDDPTLVLPSVATAIGFTPMPGSPVEVEVIRHLQPRQMLLLIDNAEHLLAETAELAARLLAACPALQVLATSRAPLHIRGEHALAVEPLPLPPAAEQSAETLAKNESVQLFVERARGASVSFRLTDTNATTVAELCRQLDGLPLAIELAAARIPLLSPEALLAQMRDRLAVLRAGPRDAPARQQTIRAAISWSHELLAAGDQELFRRLAVFTGGFTLETARAVAGNDNDAHSDLLHGLGRLVDHSLVRRVEHPGEARYAMLETVRAFGLERLTESGEEDDTRGRHAACFLRMVHELNAWVAPYLANSRQILDQLETEYPNLRAALAWRQETRDVSGLLELAGALGFFWQLRGHLRDGRTWLEWGLVQDSEAAPSARASGQLALSSILFVQHDLLQAFALCEEALRHYRDSGNAAGLARASDHAACIVMQCDQADRVDRSIDAALAALAALGDAPWARRAMSHVRYYRGQTALNRGDLTEADRVIRAVVEEQAQLAHVEGTAHALACHPLCCWGCIARMQGAFADALGRYRAALHHARTAQELQGTAWSLAEVAMVLAAVQRLDEAAWLFGATEAFCDRSGLAFFSEIWTKLWSTGLSAAWRLEGEREAGVDDFVVMGPGQRAKRPPLIPGARAARFWEAGRRAPIDDAVAFALAVDLARPTVIPYGSTYPGAACDAAHALTEREHDVLVLLCERLTDPQIAERLFLSPRTIESHVASVLRKLDVANRREAAAVAVRLGLV